MLISIMHKICILILLSSALDSYNLSNLLIITINKAISIPGNSVFSVRESHLDSSRYLIIIVVTILDYYNFNEPFLVSLGLAPPPRLILAL